MKIRWIAAASVLALSLAACSGGTGGAKSGADKGSFDPGNKLTMVVPMAAGGGSDQSGRAIAKGLEEVTGKSFSVENLPGSGGAVGYGDFMGKKGNASYLLATETAMINLPLTQKVPFTWESFTPIMKVGQDSSVIIVPGDSRYTTCKDVVNAAKAGAVKAAVSGGVTGNDAIQFNLIQKDQNVKFQQVSYESGGDAITALMGKHVDVAVTNPSEVMGQLESKDVKALCVIAKDRYKYDQLKDIPTTVEQGINVTFSQFRGIIAPGDLAPEAKEYWVNAAKKYAETDTYHKYMSENFMQEDPMFGDDFSAYLKQYQADLAAGIGK